MLEELVRRRFRRAGVGALSLVAVLAVGGCHNTPSGPPTGAATPKAAVDAFMSAVRAQDLQALSVVWGNSRGPARDAFDREQLERRELLLICYFGHDRFEVQSQRKHDENHQSLEVEVGRGKLVRTTKFDTVRSKSDRWYVENADISVMQPFCQSPTR